MDWGTTTATLVGAVVGGVITVAGIFFTYRQQGKNEQRKEDRADQRSDLDRRRADENADRERRRADENAHRERQRADDRAHRERQREMIGKLVDRVAGDLAVFEQEWTPVHEDEDDGTRALLSVKLERELSLKHYLAVGDIARVEDRGLREGADSLYVAWNHYLFEVAEQFGNETSHVRMDKAFEQMIAARKNFIGLVRTALDQIGEPASEVAVAVSDETVAVTHTE